MKEYNKIFDLLSAMTIDKDDIDFNVGSVYSLYNPYMIDKFVSSIDIYLPIVNEINKSRNIPKKVHYEFYKSMLPKKRIFFPYIKKQKEDTKSIECVAKYFEVSEREAKLYITMLSKEQIKLITDKYDFGKTK